MIISKSAIVDQKIGDFYVVIIITKYITCIISILLTLLLFGKLLIVFV